eukprot:7071117-Lingulodinium_polyedra.AAC.1
MAPAGTSATQTPPCPDPLATDGSPSHARPTEPAPRGAEMLRHQNAIKMGWVFLLARLRDL